MKNSLIKVLSFLMALTMIVGCFTAITVSAAEAGHTHTKGEKAGETVPATCAHSGYTPYKCATCGETYPDDIQPKSETHTGLTKYEAHDATCSLPAMNEGAYCVDCMMDEDGVIDWSLAKTDDKAIVMPTPVEGSVPTGHYFVGVLEGEYLCEKKNVKYCSYCGLAAEDAYLAEKDNALLNILKNKYKDIEWYQTPGCESIEDYLEHYATEFFGNGHVWTTEVTKDRVNCSNGVAGVKGEITATCEYCDKVLKEAVAFVHDFSGEYGLCDEKKGNYCVGCKADATAADVTAGLAKAKAEKRTDAERHDWKKATALSKTLIDKGYTEETLYLAPTCAKAGYQVQYCAVCNAIREKAIAKTSHTYADGTTNTFGWTAVGGELVITDTAIKANNEKIGTDDYIKDFKSSDVCRSAQKLVKYCTSCEKYIETDIEVSDARGHITYIDSTVAATCYSAGYQVEKCRVTGCEYEKKVNYTDRVAHTWGAPETEGSANNHAEDYYKLYTCTICASQDKSVRPADYQKIEMIRKAYDVTKLDIENTYYLANGHYFYKDPTHDNYQVTAANCTYKPYKYFVCAVPGCTETMPVYGAGTETTTSVVAGSSLNPSVHYTGTKKTETGTGYYVVDDKEIPYTINLYTNLTYWKIVKAPTCTADGEAYYYCDTCVAAGVEGDATLVKMPVPKKGHGTAVNYKDSNKNGEFDEGEEQLLALRATCYAAGRTEQLWCPDCLAVTTASTPIAKLTGNDVNIHIKRDGSKYQFTNVKVIPATCSEFGYTKGYCEGCQTYVQYDWKFELDSTAHVITYVLEKNENFDVAKDATCTEAGVHVHKYCEDCGMKWALTSEDVDKTFYVWTVGVNAGKTARDYTDNDKAANRVKEITVTEDDIVCWCGDYTESEAKYEAHAKLTVAAKGHSFTKTVSEKKETCTEPGWNEHKKCANCDDATQGYVRYAPHGDTKQVTYPVTVSIDLDGKGVKEYYKLPTHNETGILAGTYCSQCDQAKYTVAKIAHTKEYITVNTGDCTEPSYRYWYCTDTSCGADGYDRYVDPTSATHELEVLTHHYTLSADGTKVLLDGEETDLYPCAVPTFSYRNCKHCDYYEIIDGTYKAPVNHYHVKNGEKIEFNLSCLTVKDWMGSTCVLCGTTYNASNALHTPHLYVVAPTCTENGMVVYRCSACFELLEPTADLIEQYAAYGAQEGDKTLDITLYAAGHKPYMLQEGKTEYVSENFQVGGPYYYALNPAVVKTVVEAVAPTFGQDGYIKYVCRTCEQVITATTPYRRGIELNLAVEGEAFPGNTVKLNVVASAKDFAFNTIQMTIPAPGFKYVEGSLTLNAELFGEGVTVQTSPENVVDGVLVFSIYVSNNANAEAVNAILNANAETLVSAEFEVLPTNIGGTFGIGVSEIYDAVNKVHFVDDADAENELELDTVCFLHNDISNGYIEDFEAIPVGDTNCDGKLDAADSAALVALIYAQGENAKFDFDGDGDIDLADHVAFFKFYNSKQTLADYLELLGVDYVELVNNFDITISLDADSDIDENDYAILAYRVGQYLSQISAFVNTGYGTVESLIENIFEYLVSSDKIV